MSRKGDFTGRTKRAAFCWDTVWLLLELMSKVEALIHGYSYYQKIFHVGKGINSKVNARFSYLYRISGYSGHIVKSAPL